MIDFTKIKESHDLQTVIENYLGPPKNKFWCCPFHDDKTPSFTVQADKQYWRCFGCGKYGDVIDFVVEYENIDIKAAVNNRLGGEVDHKAVKQRQAKWELERRQKRQEALQRAEGLIDRVRYYKSQLPFANGFWKHKGLTEPTVDEYQLGYAPKCPTCPDCSSYVIPIFHQEKLVSIRHRLEQVDKGKYRPEFAGLPPVPFLSHHWQRGDTETWMDVLDDNCGLLVEGEIKAMVLDQWGFRALGIPGVHTWNEEWVLFFDHLKEIFVCLDPGVTIKHINKIAKQLTASGKKVFVCDLPAKPDDMFVLYNAQIPTFIKYLEFGRIVY